MTGEQKPGGLEVVGYLVHWEAKESPTHRCRIQLSDVVEPWVHECGPSFMRLTPAEPAEARIREFKVIAALAEARATAAEAKLARAVEGLERIANEARPVTRAVVREYAAETLAALSQPGPASEGDGE